MQDQRSQSMDRAILELDRAVALLERPAEHDGRECREALERAIECVQTAVVTTGVRTSGEPLGAALTILRSRLALIDRLLGNALDFYEGWSRVAALDGVGYDRDGLRGELAVATGMTVEG